MKRFSELIPQDRDFEVGNEVFEWVTPYWEDLAAIFDEDVALIAKAAREQAALEANPEGAPEQLAEKTDETKKSQERIQARIMLFLAEKDHARWKALCARKDDPVPMFMFQEVYRWLLETATGRPTPQPSASEPGAGNGAASSPAASPSRAARRRR